MKTNTSKKRNFYTQGQQFVARVLFILWLLASSSLESILAAPEHEKAIIPATTTSPSDPSLASTPSTPPPRSTLQLPPDSLDSLSGDNIAIDTAPQRQPASNLLPITRDKLPSQLANLRPQEAPRTQARPVTGGSENNMRREAVYQALWRVAHFVPSEAKDILPLFKETVQNQDSHICLDTVNALGKMVQAVPKQVLPIFQGSKAFAKNPAPQVRPDTVDVFEHMKRLQLPFEQISYIIPELDTFARNRALEARRGTIDKLGRMLQKALAQVPTIFQESETFDRSQEPQVCLDAIDALGEVIQVAPSEAPAIIQQIFAGVAISREQHCPVRFAGLKALNKAIGAAPDEAPVTILILLNAIENTNTIRNRDEDKMVLKAALGALRKALEAAASKAPKIIESLLLAARYEDYSLKQTALQTLEQALEVGPSKAPAFTLSLLYAAQQQNEDVRKAIRESLLQVVQLAPSEAPALRSILLGTANSGTYELLETSLEALQKSLEIASSEASELINILLLAANYKNANYKGSSLQKTALKILDTALKALETVLKADPSKTPSFTQRLIAAAKNASPEVRETALEALRRTLEAAPSEASQIIEILRLAASYKNSSLKQTTLKTLETVLEANPSKALNFTQQLIAAAKNASPEVRETALEALRRTLEAAPSEASQIIEILRLAASYKNSSLKQTTLKTLETVLEANPSKTPSFTQRLIAAAKNASPEICETALEALRRTLEAAPSEASQIIEILRLAVKHKDYPLKQTTLKALETVLEVNPSKAPSFAKSLIEAAKEQNDDIREAVQEALLQVVRGAPSEATNIRLILIDTAKDAPPEVRKTVLEALKSADPSRLSDAYKAREVAKFPDINSYILLAKLSHFVERIAITEQLSDILSDKGVCVLHGFGGAGKSTLAAHYGHGRKATQTVRWIGAENTSKLKEGYEQLAQELQVAYQPLAKKLAADASQYRQELARMVYDALEKSSQPTLLILDNAQDASLVADYMLHRPDAIQAIITTRSAEAFEGTYEQLQLGAFSQGEGEDYLEVRLKKMKRAYTPHEVVSLLEEVGLVAQKLNLAAGYLQANKLVKAAQYIARLQALKQAGTKQQGKLTLPEVALGLETLTKEGQQLMQYAAYLDADFIPFSLVSVLLGEEDPEQLSEVASDLSRLSLMQVVSTNEGQELGLQVHREVQASCREYKDWCAEAALGSRGTILSRLAEVLEAQMPWVKSSPDERWQRAKLYAPHVAKVVSRLGSPNAQTSAVVARLLGCMGQYSKEVALNYPEALEYQKQVLQIYQTLHKGDHPDVARALSEIGTTLSRAGQLQEALENKLQVLEMRKRLAKGQDDPEVAYVLNSAGEILTHLGKHIEALKYKQEGLAMRKRLFPGDHTDVARSLISVGISYENLERLSEALAPKQEALVMRERLTPSQDNTDTAHSLQNVGETEIKIGKAEQGLAHCQQGLAMRKRLFKDKDHPNIAQSLYGVGLGYAALGDYQQAAAHYQQAVEMALRVFKGAHQDLTKYCRHLIEILPKLQEEQVQQTKAALVPLCSDVLGEEHVLTKDLLAA